MKNTSESKAAVKDPVCGMDVEAQSAAGQTEHKGQTYFFCSTGCKKKFDINPEQYLDQSATQKSGDGSS